MTVYKDIKLMRKTWPTFCVMRNTSRFVQWRGPLQPICQVYRVEIRYRVKRSTNRSRVEVPEVTVLDPLLRRRAEEPNGPVPHHYPNPKEPKKPILCLYDPAAAEWMPEYSIAKTIVPWTIDWLACYEGWLATGEWTGGGREHSA